MQNRNRASEDLAETSNEYNYYCPDKKVWKETGYFRSVPEAVQKDQRKDVIKMDYLNKSSG